MKQEPIINALMDEGRQEPRKCQNCESDGVDHNALNPYCAWCHIVITFGLKNPWALFKITLKVIALLRAQEKGK